MEWNGFCEVNGTKLRTVVKGEGEVLLLLHGGYSNMTVWDELAERLAISYTVIRYDQRGYGESAAPSEPFSYYEDIKSVLDYFGIRKAHIAASSFGGAAAIDFTLAHPEYVSKLVLVAPSIHGMKYPLRMQWEGMADYLRVNRVGIEKAARRFMNSRFWRYLIPRNESRAQKLLEMYTANKVFYSSRPTLAKPLQPHALGRLEEVRQPVMIIEAGNDHPFNRKACQLLANRLPDSRKIVLAGSGHYPHLEYPVETVKILAAFLDGSLDHINNDIIQPEVDLS
ncbi:alpha/beta fold hydrolase [Paenibacillus tarimensis]|uniref:alpha/beta fold hydrolase n=1 Tax=Paenibacillus tarimensis TaxID=416012 RepID=UPI001F465D24|nr:alpha/beta hydrolase [Paenibacillus tarimensis]MCF2945708.1 alpha/beta hydrolase [Paenibacillus tarimensis]